FINVFTDFIKKAVMLNSKRLEHGVKSLEDEVEDFDDEYFKMGLRMIIDEVDLKLVDEILSNILSHEKGKYKRIYMTIVKRTVIGIQEGISSRILIMVSLSLANLPKSEQNTIECELLKD
ncbi:MAG: hypothetical protein FWB83_07860, partial [Treponema sp.]|nr:hypothetical protein [Treponema sp.]